MTESAPSPVDNYILLALGVGLLVAMTTGAARGLKRGPVRALASLLALLAATLCAWLFGGPLGHLVFGGTLVPWIFRGAIGIVGTGAVVFLLVFGFLWWRGRVKNDTGDPERPVSGAIVGCWVGMIWFSAGLLFLLALAAIGDAWAEAAGTRRGVPSLLRYPMRVKAALASRPGTEPVSRINPLPEKPARIFRKALTVVRSPAAFRRLQNDDSVRALAAHPAFYPLIIDDEIKEIVRRGDAEALISHPRVVALLQDEEFQRRLMDAEIEPMLDRALARPPAH